MNISFSTNDARSCLLPVFGSDPDAVECNSPQVLCALNIYAALLEDLGIPYGLQLEVKHGLLSRGLSSFVEDCATLAEGLLEGLGTPGLIGTHDEFRWVSAYCSSSNSMYMLRTLDWICTHGAGNDTDLVRSLLQFLLFFERFTYISDTASADGAIRKFLERNRKCKLINYGLYPWPGPYLLRLVREELKCIYTPSDWAFSSDNAHFSSGSTTDSFTGRALIGKLKALSNYQPYLYGSPLYPLEGGAFGRIRVSEPRLLAVPKSLNSRRIIAPELTHYAYHAQAALDALRGMLSCNGSARFINEHDQSVNQFFARRGSADGSYATIDLSGASDSMPKSLFLGCLPYPFVDMYLNYMSHYIRVPHGKGYQTVPLHIAFTSGNPLTWLTEACWFLALGRAGCVLAGVKSPSMHVFAYGDDLIVPSDAYETVCDVLEAFGHTVNRRKSYGFGVFRESCGGWYYRGHNVTPTYWPRREVTSDVPTITSSLCSLQHNLYAAGYSSAAARCAELAKSFLPRLTSSPAFADCDDLWDPDLDEYTSEKYRHTTFTVKWTAKASALADGQLARMYEMYIYTQYLREGPMYTCALDELLKVSCSRYKPLEAYGVPTLVAR